MNQVSTLLILAGSLFGAIPAWANGDGLGEALTKLQSDSIGRSLLVAAEAKARSSGGLRSVLGYCQLGGTTGAAVVFEPEFSVSDFQSKSLGQLLGPPQPAEDRAGEVQWVVNGQLRVQKGTVRTIDRRSYFELRFKPESKPWIICVNKNYQGPDLDVFLLHEFVHYVNAAAPKETLIKNSVIKNKFSDYEDIFIRGKGMELEAYLAHWSYAIRTGRPQLVPKQFLRFFQPTGEVIMPKSDEMLNEVAEALLEGRFIERQESVTSEMHSAAFGYRFSYAKEYYNFANSFKGSLEIGLIRMRTFRLEREAELKRLEESARIAAQVNPDSVGTQSDTARVLIEANQRAIENLGASEQLYADLLSQVNSTIQTFTNYLIERKWLKGSP